MKPISSVKLTVSLNSFLFAKLSNRVNFLISLRCPRLSLFAHSLVLAFVFIMPPFCHSEEEQLGGWKPIWSFTIPYELEQKRSGKFLQQEPGIAISPDGRTYLREGKIYDFATNKPLVEVAPSKSEGETGDKKGEGLFAFNPAGMKPKKPEKFDPGSDFEHPGGLAKPEYLPLSSSFYTPTKGLSQPSVKVKGTTIIPAGSLAMLLGIPEAIAKEEHEWCFISPDQKRIVLGSGDRLKPKLLYVEFDPKTQTEVRRKSTTAPFQVERVRFIEDGQSVLLIPKNADPSNYSEAVWNTKEITARSISFNLAYPDVKTGGNRKYIFGGYGPTPIDVSPNGRTIAIVGPQIDSSGFYDTNLLDTAEKQRREAPFFGLLLLYDVTQQKQQEHRLAVGASKIRFIDNKTILISYFEDRRKAENPREEENSGWRISPRGNNGLAIYDLETKKLSILRKPVDNLLKNNIVYLDTAGGSLIAVHDTPQGIRVDGLSKIQNLKPALVSNESAQESSHFLPLFDNTTYYYEAKVGENILYHTRTYRKLPGENGDTWTMAEGWTKNKSEEKYLDARVGNPFGNIFNLLKKQTPPFPVFTRDQGSYWKLEYKEGFLNQSQLAPTRTGFEGSQTETISGAIKIFPTVPKKTNEWKNDIKEGHGGNTLGGYVETNYFVNEICNSRTEDSDGKLFMVVERKRVIKSDIRNSEPSSEEIQEKFQKGLGLIEISKNTGEVYTLKHIRSGNKELPGHPMECTIYQGKESVSNGVFTMAFYSFQNGKFKGIFYPPPSTRFDPVKFEGQYNGDRLKFIFSFDPNQPASGFEGVFKKGGVDQIIGKFSLVNGQKVTKIDYKANRWN